MDVTIFPYRLKVWFSLHLYYNLDASLLLANLCSLAQYFSHTLKCNNT